MCGLAYCRELVFTSTAFGESIISEMRCDAQKMREMLNRNVNGEEVFKNYGSKFKIQKGDDEIFGVEFKDFYDSNGNLVMWLWFALSRFKGVISKGTAMRGIRLRKENIQIGNENALQKLFKEDRGQHYFIGEVYGVSKELVPNSQRDYFNENEMRLWFERELRKYFKESLAKVYRGGSDVNSAFTKIDNYEKRVNEHNRKVEQNEFNDIDHRTKSEKFLQKSEDKASEAQKTIDKLKQSFKSDDASKIIKRVVEKVENERKKEQQLKTNDINNVSKKTPKPKKSQNRTDKLSRCSKQERKLIGKIYNIILESTDEKTAETIIKNIEDEFK